MVISIDGPTASGKSTIAKLLARDLNFDYLYTGLLYRALAYILVKKFSYSRNDLRQPREIDIKTVLDSPEFIYSYSVEKGPRIVYEDQNITPFLKTAEVDDWSSISSVDENVRRLMVAYQQAYVKKNNAVVEGRDVGTVVFPQTPYKFYLTACLEERGRRWQKDQEGYGNNFSLQESIDQVNRRDERDSKRAISPLKIAEGAQVIDGTDLSLSEIVALIKKNLSLVGPL